MGLDSIDVPTNYPQVFNRYFSILQDDASSSIMFRVALTISFGFLVKIWLVFWLFDIISNILYPVAYPNIV